MKQRDHLIRIHLCDAIQRRETHVVVLGGTAILCLERIGALRDLAERIRIAALGLLGAEAGAELLGVAQRRGAGIALFLAIQGDDGEREVVRGTAPGERVRPVVQGVGRELRVGIPIRDGRKESCGLLEVAVVERGARKTIERIGRVDWPFGARRGKHGRVHRLTRKLLTRRGSGLRAQCPGRDQKQDTKEKRRGYVDSAQVPAPDMPAGMVERSFGMTLRFSMDCVAASRSTPRPPAAYCESCISTSPRSWSKRGRAGSSPRWDATIMRGVPSSSLESEANCVSSRA